MTPALGNLAARTRPFGMGTTPGSAARSTLSSRVSARSVSVSGVRDRKWQFWIDRGGTFTDVIAYSKQPLEAEKQENKQKEDEEHGQEEVFLTLKLLSGKQAFNAIEPMR